MTTTAGTTTDELTGFAPVFTETEAIRLCREAVEAAREAGAAEADAFLMARRGDWTRFAGDRIPQPQDLVEETLMIRAVVDGRSARVGTDDLEGIATAAARAVEIARSLAATAGPGAVPDPQPATELVIDTELLWHDSSAGWGPDARSTLAKTAMAAAAEVGGVAHGVFGRAINQLAVVTTTGIERHAVATEAVGSMTVTVGDGSSHWSDLDRDLTVLGVEQAIERTVAEAVAAQNRIALPDGVYDVVLGPLATGGLLDTMSAYGFDGAAVASGVGAVARRRGEQVAAPAVELSDSPTAARGLPFPFDLEGTPSRYVPFLRHGVVADAVTDLESAAAAGLPATGHAHIAREETPSETPASITMAPGDLSTEELIAGISRGVYIQRVWYLRVVDPATTQLTGGSRDACFLIEDGSLTQPIASARFTESVFGVLSRVDAIGSEVAAQPLMNVWNGSVTAPAIRVRGFRFGAAPAAPADGLATSQSEEELK